MTPLLIKRYIIRLYLLALALFLLNKLALRPLILGRDLPVALEVFVLSVPNTIEAIIGTLTITGLLSMARHRLAPRLDSISEPTVFLLAAFLAGVYVLTQEFKIHNLGGRNVYDPYDAAASILGLAATLTILCLFGFLQPREQPQKQQ